MAIFFNDKNLFLQNNNLRQMKTQPEKVIEDEVKEGTQKSTEEVKQQTAPKVGTGSWSTQQIKDTGLEIPSEFFICVYTDYYRFNPDTISREFPNADIQTLADLKAAIDAKNAGKGLRTNKELIRVSDRIKLSTLKQEEIIKNFQPLKLDFVKAEPANNPFVSPEIQGTGSVRNEAKLKDEIEAFLYELDAIDTSGDNYARHLSNEQINKLTNYLEILKDKDNYPNLTLEVEFKDGNLCDIYLKSGGEYVYSVDDIDSTIPALQEIAAQQTEENPDCPALTDIVDFEEFEETNSVKLQKFMNRLEGNEFDIQITGNDALEVIKEMTDLLKVDLKERYNFSDAFLDSVIEAAKKECIWHGTSKYNLKELLHSIKKDIESLTGKAVYKGDNWEQYMDYASYTINYIQSFDYYSISDSPYARQNRYMHNLFDNAYKKLDLKSYKEQEGFNNMILEVISRKIGIPASQITPKDIKTKLDSNNNESWIDEVYDIINQFVSANELEAGEDVDKIDTNVLFGNNTTIDAKFISEQLYGTWSIDGKSGLKKLSAIIQQSLRNMGIYNIYDENEFLESMIKVINNKLGIKNTTPPTLTKDAVEQLNNNIFETIENILKSEEFKKSYYLDIDGNIDDFSQGNTGDCWLLSGINALSVSERGKQYIKDAIKDNGDGTYTVTFKGRGGWSCTISYNDIVNARNSGKYSHGDTDVLLLELAVEKLYSGRIPNAGSPEMITKALTGSDYVHFNYQGDKIINVLKYEYDNFKKGNTAICLNNYSKISLKDINGNDVELVGNHVYSIVDMYKDEKDPSKNTVTIINPWNSDKPIVLSWDEFAKIGSNCMIGYDYPMDTVDIDQAFEPYINGDENADYVMNVFAVLSYSGYRFTSEQKEYIYNKAQSLGFSSTEMRLLKISF